MFNVGRISFAVAILWTLYRPKGGKTRDSARQLLLRGAFEVSRTPQILAQAQPGKQSRLGKSGNQSLDQ
jgi:hypothetical protein